MKIKLEKYVNNCVKKKRELIAKTLRNQINGFWSGHTAYHIAVDGGFLKDVYEELRINYDTYSNVKRWA